MSAIALNRFMTAPNLLSLLRIALTPVLLALIWAGDRHGFFWTLVVAFATDVLDGFLARRLGQVTALGAALDSYGDIGTVTAMFIGVGFFIPDALQRLGVLTLVGFGLFMALQVVCFVRFRQPGMLHTWLAKASGVIGAIAIMSFFWAGHVTPLGYVAWWIAMLAQVEQIGIAFTLHRWQTDMVSWWHVYRKA